MNKFSFDRSDFCVTEDGLLLAITPWDWFEFKDGSWVKPSRPLFGADVHDARPVSNEEWAMVSKAPISILDHSA